MANFHKRLKNILVKRGCLTSREADDAMQLATQEGQSLTQVVVDRFSLGERDVIAAVAQEMNMPPIDVTRIRFEPEVLECIPQDLAKFYGVLPVSKIGDILTLAVSNPFDILRLDDIRIVTGCNIRPVVSTELSIYEAIAKAYDRSAEALDDIYDKLVDPELELVEDTLDNDEDELEDKSPIVRIVNTLIQQAVMKRVSDIHIEPMEKKLRVRLRRDGVLEEFKLNGRDLPFRHRSAITSRIKIMSKLDIAEKRIPQDGKFQTKIQGRKIDFRVSTLPLTHGEKVVMRILDSGNLALDLASLGFEDQALDAFTRALAAPYGMVLVTGPTGSGKTTTLYSSLRELMTIEDNVVTVEDPVEYQLEGVNQVMVNPKRGLTFAAALRSILRQDPDTVMIGEMRDLETVQIAIKAALTGHLVLSTLHTNDAASTITRITDMGVDPFMVSSTVVLASAQRLMRKICGECREPMDIPAKRLLAVGYTEEEVEAKPQFFRARGCSRCSNGYAGRFAVLEALLMSERIQRIILEGAGTLDIKKAAVEDGMVSLRRCGLMNAMRGKTTLEEVMRITASDDAKKEAALDN
ncbi:MAG: GspE/PulE family protein [Planctomycetota bacterium]|jgi:type IV pilus assembly protein PilB